MRKSILLFCTLLFLILMSNTTGETERVQEKNKVEGVDEEAEGVVDSGKEKLDRAHDDD